MRNPLPPASHPNPLHCNAVNGSFTINVNQYTTYQALDWLKRANADVRARLRASAWCFFLTRPAADYRHRSEQHVIWPGRVGLQSSHSGFAGGELETCARPLRNADPSLSRHRNVFCLALLRTIARLPARRVGGRGGGGDVLMNPQRTGEDDADMLDKSKVAACSAMLVQKGKPSPPRRCRGQN